MSALDDKIDALYRLPLGEFTAARNALAKTLAKDEATQIKALEKPTVVPWAVNQVYWNARSTYDRLMKAGERLRVAQIAALEGKHADVRGAGDAHRRAISEAVGEAERLASASGAKPGADALVRTFESLSLSSSASHRSGRLTDALQPAGFEALAGLGNLALRTRNAELKPKLGLAPRSERRTENVEPRTPPAQKAAEKTAAAAAAKEAAEKKKHEAAIKAAEADLERVQAAEEKARSVWEKAHDELVAARQALTDVRRSRFRSS